MSIEIISSEGLQAAVYDVLIDAAQARIEAAPPPDALSLFSFSEKDAQRVALRQSWALIVAGLKHLKDGTHLSGPGSLAGAFHKTNLAASDFAVSINAQNPAPPEQAFRRIDPCLPVEMGPLVRSGSLMTAVIDDLPARVVSVAEKLDRVSPDAAFRYDALTHPVAGRTPPEVPRKRAGQLFDQVNMVFNALVPAYESACREFRHNIGETLRGQRHGRRSLA